MRVVDRDAMLALPAGTIYSNTEDGKYARGIYRKGETQGDGWAKTELLPQRTALSKGPLPTFQPSTWCPREGYEPGEPIFVYDPEDLARLLGSLTVAPRKLVAPLSDADLYAFYYDRLKWCGCGNPEDALRLMQRVLAAIRDRSAAGHDAASNAKLDAALGADPDLARSYLYTLDAAGLLEHGSSIGGSWLTAEGQAVLAALEARDDDALDRALEGGDDGDLDRLAPAPPRCRHCHRPVKE